MVAVRTTRFGVLEADEERIVTFPAGLVGFPRLTRYLLVGSAEGSLKWLQAVDDPAVAFIVADPRAVGSERTFLPGSDVLRFVGADRAEDLEILVIVRAEGDGVVAHLRGPLAIHRARRLGVQAVLERV